MIVSTPEGDTNIMLSTPEELSRMFTIDLPPTADELRDRFQNAKDMERKVYEDFMNKHARDQRLAYWGQRRRSPKQTPKDHAKKQKNRRAMQKASRRANRSKD